MLQHKSGELSFPCRPVRRKKNHFTLQMPQNRRKLGGDVGRAGSEVVDMPFFRKHHLCRPGSRFTRQPTRQRASLQIGHFTAFLLHWLVLLRVLPPLLLAQETLGPVRFVRRSGGADHRRGRHCHGEADARGWQRCGMGSAAAAGTGCASVLRTGSRFSGLGVQRTDECRSDQHLL